MIKFIFKDEVQSIAILVKELEKVPCTIPKQNNNNFVKSEKRRKARLEQKAQTLRFIQI